MTTEHAAIRLQRIISAPPERVYRAWLEPELLQRWMAPGSTQVARVEVDERVGGRYRIWQENAGGDVGGFECELLELVPSERIVWRWGFVGPARTDGPTFDSRLTVTLRDAPGASTELTTSCTSTSTRYATRCQTSPTVSTRAGLRCSTSSRKPSTKRRHEPRILSSRDWDSADRGPHAVRLPRR